MEITKLKQKNTKRYILIGSIGILLLVGITLTFTKAKYKTAESIPLVNGTINYELSDLNLIGAYIQQGEEYVKTDTIPTSGYEFNPEQSYCTINNERDDNITVNFDMDTQNLTVTPLTTKGTKCYLYFDQKASASDTILANEGGAAVIEGKGTPNFATVATTDMGMYAAQDKYGTSYYYRGAVQDNWVKFGTNASGQELYWRIIRINGDGTIRLIYNGTSTATTGTSTQIQTSAFNSSYNNNAYVGYMYALNNVHGLTTNSTIKGVLDTWYQNNLADEAEYIEGSTGFCGDRQPYSGTGLGTTQTYYAAYNRLYTNKAPVLTCTNDSDLYTTSGSGQGNQALTNPIGLITADEVAMAGGVYGTNNQSYYLYTGQTYWTLSPYFYNSSGGAGVFDVSSTGYLDVGNVYGTAPGVRPVINLKSDLALSGTGSATDPYTIQ